MPTASWNGAVIAEARDDEVEIVENNVYFPPSSLKRAYLRLSMEGQGQLLQRGRGRQGQRQRRLVLPGAVRRRQADQGLRGLLARRRRAALTPWRCRPSRICKGSRRTSTRTSRATSIPITWRRCAGSTA